MGSALHYAPSEMGSALKWKHLLPPGSKCFPFKEDPFSEGRQNNFDRSDLEFQSLINTVKVILSWSLNLLRLFPGQV